MKLTKVFAMAAVAATLSLGQVSEAGTEAKSAANQSQVTKESATKMIQDWPDTAKKAAQAMLDKYGAPGEATPSLLIWRDNGPWKRTIVYKEEIQHNFPMPHKDVLEQVVNLDVPTDKFDELAAFDGSVIVERTRGEIAARCDKEGANFLALNLAKDIIDGKKNVEQARKAYGENMQAMMNGKKPELLQQLTFEVAQNVTNPDNATIGKAASSGATSEGPSAE